MILNHILQSILMIQISTDWKFCAPRKGLTQKPFVPTIQPHRTPP